MEWKPISQYGNWQKMNTVCPINSTLHIKHVFICSKIANASQHQIYYHDLSRLSFIAELIAVRFLMITEYAACVDSSEMEHQCFTRSCEHKNRRDTVEKTADSQT